MDHQNTNSEKKPSKQQRDQTLTSIGFILGLIVFGFAAFLLNSIEKSSDHVRALKRADKYAQMLIDTDFKYSYEDMININSQESVNRNIASSVGRPEVLEGAIGLDPWGYPFQYFVNKNKVSNVGRIIIWSSGPDRKFQTSLEKIKKILSHSEKIHFMNDDFGKAIQFKLAQDIQNK